MTVAVEWEKVREMAIAVELEKVSAVNVAVEWDKVRAMAGPGQADKGRATTSSGEPGKGRMTTDPVVLDNEKYTRQWKVYQTSGRVEDRNEIVLQYTDLVRRIVLWFKGSYNNFGQLDDMVNQGMIALIDAVEKFDPQKGNKFETFASLKIRGAIIDFMRKQDWMPRNQRSLARELDEVYGALYAQYGREPAKEEIAKAMGVSVRHLEKILEQRHNAVILSYEEVVYEKMMVPTSLISCEDNRGTPESEVLFGELKSQLAEAIDALKEKERTVISLYYYENLKLKEIAEILSITESRVSQIHSAALIKIKHLMSQY